MKEYPFYEVKNIRHAKNDDKNVAVLTDRDLFIYEFVPREDFQRICEVGDECVIGYLKHGCDIERVYTIFEIFADPGEYITPGFYPPRDDN